MIVYVAKSNNIYLYELTQKLLINIVELKFGSYNKWAQIFSLSLTLISSTY